MIMIAPGRVPPRAAPTQQLRDQPGQRASARRPAAGPPPARRAYPKVPSSTNCAFELRKVSTVVG